MEIIKYRDEYKQQVIDLIPIFKMRKLKFDYQ